MTICCSSPSWISWIVPSTLQKSPSKSPSKPPSKITIKLGKNMGKSSSARASLDRRSLAAAPPHPLRWLLLAAAPRWRAAGSTGGMALADDWWFWWIFGGNHPKTPAFFEKNMMKTCHEHPELTATEGRFKKTPAVIGWMFRLHL